MCIRYLACYWCILADWFIFMSSGGGRCNGSRTEMLARLDFYSVAVREGRARGTHLFEKNNSPRSSPCRIPLGVDFLSHFAGKFAPSFFAAGLFVVRVPAVLYGLCLGISHFLAHARKLA